MFDLQVVCVDWQRLLSFCYFRTVFDCSWQVPPCIRPWQGLPISYWCCCYSNCCTADDLQRASRCVVCLLVAHVGPAQYATSKFSLRHSVVVGVGWVEIPLDIACNLSLKSRRIPSGFVAQLQALCVCKVPVPRMAVYAVVHVAKHR